MKKFIRRLPHILLINCIFVISFLVFRFLLFDLHKMDEWSFILFVFGIIALNIALIINLKYMTYMTLSSYTIGFFAGVIFDFDYFDPGGGRLTAQWLIWAVVMIAIIAIAIIIEIIRCFYFKFRKRGQNSK